ncbi:dsRBD fold-containing protein [Streptomyces sp. NPDC001194]|uniref:dsRBD fold-containing protein n=1 Tax=Streptomyces sp. NPDC001194 TaxID=3364547 RepID=UPI003674A63E
MTHTAEWKVGVWLTEEGGTTRARAVLDTGAGQLVGRGLARCNPEDVEVAAIGDELAASRAMRDLAGQLSRTADRNLVALGEPPRMPRTGYGWHEGTDDPTRRGR